MWRGLLPFLLLGLLPLDMLTGIFWLLGLLVALRALWRLRLPQVRVHSAGQLLGFGVALLMLRGLMGLTEAQLLERARELKAACDAGAGCGVGSEAEVGSWPLTYRIVERQEVEGFSVRTSFHLDHLLACRGGPGVPVSCFETVDVACEDCGESWTLSAR